MGDYPPGRRYSLVYTETYSGRNALRDRSSRTCLKITTASFNVCYTEEALQEVDQLLKSKAFYVGPDGRFTADLETDTIKYVLHNLTAED